MPANASERRQMPKSKRYIGGQNYILFLPKTTILALHTPSMRHSFVILLLFNFAFASCNHTKSPQNEAHTKAKTKVVSVLDSLSVAIKANPTPDALHARAQLYAGKALYAEALADMKSVLTMDSAHAPYLVTLGDIYLALNGSKAAADAYQHANQIDSTNAGAWLGLGRVAYIEKKYPKAIECINKCLRKEVNNADAYFWKGMVYKDMKEKQKAKSNFTTATEQDPNFAEAYLQLGLAAEAENDSIALRYYTNAIRADSTLPDAWYARGLWYQNHHRNVQAKADYLAQTRADSTNPHPWFNMGIMALNAKNWQTAADDFLRSTQTDSAFAKAWYFRAQALEKLGNAAAAANARQMGKLAEKALKP